MLMQSHLPVREKTAADQPWIEGLLRERWGGTVAVVHGARFDAAHCLRWSPATDRGSPRIASTARANS
jgi:hypothetical protein